MKILLIGKFYVEGFAEHIGQTLEHMGHAVSRFDFGARARPGAGPLRQKLDKAAAYLEAVGGQLPAFRRWSVGGLRDEVRRLQPDMILICYDFLTPREVASLKSESQARIVLWYPDALVNFGRSYFMLAPYDALFFKDPYVVRALQDVVESPVYYLPECYNPLVHRLPDEGMTEEDRRRYACDITTAGNMYAYRIAFMRHLRDYHVKLWGNPPPTWAPAGALGTSFQSGYVVGTEKAKAFHAASIVLDNMHPGEIWGINCRAFEAAGIGAFLMLDWKPGLSQLFEDEKEVVSYRSIGDLRAKIDHYLRHPEERARIAQAGQRRARAEHTYEGRLTLLLETVAGRQTGFPLPDISYGEPSCA